MGCCGGDGDRDPDEKAKFDPDFKGPLENRHCTDTFWLLLFVAFWVGMVVVAGIGFSEGDPNYLIHGYDSFGNVCGQANDKAINNTNSGLDMSSRGRLFYVDPTDLDTLRLCVESCPTDGNAGATPAQAAAAGLCLTSPYTADGSQDGNSNFDSDCVEAWDGGTVFLNRCIPTEGVVSAAASALETIFKDINADGVSAEVVADFESSWEVIVYLCLLSAVVAMLIVFLMRFIAWFLVWVCYWISYIAIIALAGFLWYSWKTTKDDNDAATSVTQGAKDNEKWYLVGSIAWSIIGGILLLILIFMYSRIKLTIALFREASTAILHMPLIVFMPVWIFMLVVMMIAYFVFVMMYLYTAADVTEDANGYAEFNADRNLFYMWWYHLFGTLWTLNLILAFNECAIAGAIATYFFTRNKKKLGSPILGGIWRAIRYHLGSLAFGAFIIAVVQLMRIILEYIDRKLKGKKSKLVDFVMKCLKCCLWCFEKCLKFLNRNAYIEIAIYGIGFCNAAKRAFFLLLRNVARVFAINSVGDFVLFLGKVTIVALCTIGATIWIKRLDDVTYWAVPVFVVMVFSYIVASIFLSVYEMTIDTLFICFVEDSERNDGTADKPYFMSKNLLRLLSKKSRNRQKATEAGAKEPPYDKAKTEEGATD